MTSPAKELIAFPSEYERLKTDYDASHQATLERWQEEIAAAKRLQDSGTWKAFAPTWKLYCDNHMPYADSTYREAQGSIPIAEIAAAVADTTLSREESNLIGKKLRETMPDEKLPMRLSVLALCYAFHDADGITKNVPDKNIISEAYEVLREERDNHTISVDGKSYDYRELAQLSRLKDRVTQDIQSRSKRVTIGIEESRQIGLLLRVLRRLGHNVPSDGKKLFISW